MHDCYLKCRYTHTSADEAILLNLHWTNWTMLHTLGKTHTTHTNPDTKDTVYTSHRTSLYTRDNCDTRPLLMQKAKPPKATWIHPENIILIKENRESTDTESSTICMFISQISWAEGFTILPDLMKTEGGCVQTTLSCVSAPGCVLVNWWEAKA